MIGFHKCGECGVMFTLDDPAALTANYESVCAERDRLKAALVNLLHQYDVEGSDEDPFFDAIAAARQALQGDGR